MEKTVNEIVSEYSNGNVELDGIEIKKSHFIELLTKYLNDKNSSTLRQDIMCEVAGVKSNPNKLGYDGDGTADEMKPKNVDTTNPKSKKLDGGGNYSDMTHKRHEAFCEQNAVIHIGGFVDGKHIYQFKVPYNDLSDYFKSKLNDHLPHGDVSNRYLRSMTFSLRQLKKCENVQLEFISQDIDEYRGYMTKTLYTYLKELSDND
jgi:hypothetical protein